MRKNSWLLLVTLFVTSMLLTGCWDRVEIEERGFVMAMGLDLVQDSIIAQKAQEELQGRHGMEQRTRISATYQLAIPARMQGGGTKDGSTPGGAEENAFLNFTTEGDTLFETVRVLATRSSRSLYFEHNKLVLIGEDLARSGEMPKFIDMLLRDHEMRRRMKVIVVKGKAKEALQALSQQENMTSVYLDSVAANSRKTARMPKEVMLGDLSEKMISKTCFVLQRLVPHEKEVKMAGAAVFHGKDYQMHGWLGEEETEALNFITGKVRSAIVEAEMPSGELVVYEIRQLKSKIKPHVKNGKFKFDVKIEMEGSLGESESKGDALDKQFIAQVEKAVEKDVRESAMQTIKKLQTELDTDVLGFSKALERKEPKTWKRIENDWDRGQDYFRDAEVNVTVKAQVRFPGIITSLYEKTK